MVRSALALLIAVAALSLSGACLAGAPGSADALFDEGAALLKAGKVEQACGKLAQSQSVEPAIGTLGLLAYCHEQSGKLATAMREYGEVAELAHLASQAEREKIARERVAELATRVSRLSLVLSEPADGLEVYLDARLLGASELGASTPVDAGSAELRIVGKDLEPWAQALQIPADGSTLRVVVPKLARKPLAAAPVPARPPAPAAKKSLGLRRPAMWASFGAGAVGVAVGSYFGLRAMSARSDASSHCVGNVCDRTGVDARNDALDRARVSTVAFAVGAAFGAAGAVLLLTDPSHEQPRQAAVRPLPGGASLSWEGAF
jgi:hypothetical protein